MPDLTASYGKSLDFFALKMIQNWRAFMPNVTVGYGWVFFGNFHILLHLWNIITSSNTWLDTQFMKVWVRYNLLVYFYSKPVQTVSFNM